MAVQERDAQMIAQATAAALAGARMAPDLAAILKDQTRWRVLGPGMLIPPKLP